MVKRTFEEKRSEARAIVKSREVSRLERGIKTKREGIIEKRTGVSALERARYELETERETIRKLQEEPIKKKVDFSQVKGRVTEVLKSYGKPSTFQQSTLQEQPREPLHVTRQDIAPPEPMVDVFAGTRPYGAGVTPIWEKRPLSETITYFKEDLPTRGEIVGEVKPAKKIGVVKKARGKIIKTITPPAFEVGAGVVSIPVGLGKVVVSDVSKVITGDLTKLQIPKTVLETVTGEFLFKPETHKFISRVARAEPRAIGEFAGIVLTSYLTGKAFKFGREISPRARATLFEKRFVLAKKVGKKTVFEKATFGERFKTIFKGYDIKRVKGAGTLAVEDPFKFPTTKGDVSLQIAPPLHQLDTSARVQLALTGRSVTAVSGAIDFFKPFRRKVKIKKPPVPKEPIQESFFADPYGRLRLGRAGLEEPVTATFLEAISGKATFRKTKPQALVFPEVKVADVPQHLKGIYKKLKAGIPISEVEHQRYLKWQLTPTGEFKPVGRITKGRVTPEPEITLAPLETAKKVKKIGVTIIGKKRVPFLEAGVTKLTKETAQLLKKSKAGIISKVERARLEHRYKRETGFSLSRVTIAKPYYDPSRPLKKLPLLAPSIIKPSKPVKQPKITRRPSIYQKISLKPQIKPISSLFLAYPSISTKPRTTKITRSIEQLMGTPRTIGKPIKRPPERRRLPRRRKETEAERKQRRLLEARYRKQLYAYQPSVGAYALGITAPAIPKIRITGWGLRPMVKRKRSKKKGSKSSYSKNYARRINKILG